MSAAQHVRTSVRHGFRPSDIMARASRHFLLIGVPLAWLVTIAMPSASRAEPSAPAPRIGAVSRFTDHEGSVLGLAFSADGKWLASASSDRTVRLWNLETGRVGWVLRGHADKVWCVAFSPDGSLLASGGDDRTIRLWKTVTGEPVATLEGHTDRVNSVIFSPDGKRLASGGKDKSVRVWDVAARRPLRTLSGPTGGVQCVAFSPDGRTLAAASTRVYLFDTDSEQENAGPRSTLDGHSSYVTGVAFSRDGKRLASAGADSTVRLWNLADGRQQHVLQGHTDRVNAVRFAHNDRLVISAGQDATVRVWDATSGGELQTLAGHADAVWSLAVADDGSLAASGGGDKLVRLWRVGGTAPAPAAPFVAGDLAEIQPLAGPPRGAKGESATTTVMLTAHDAYDAQARASRGLLLREIARQALLIAAREELGLATRDTALRQVLAAEGEPERLPLELTLVLVPGEAARITVFRRDATRVEVLRQFRLELPEASAMETLVAECERLARGEFVGLLRQAGFEGRKPPVDGDGPLDPETQALLPQMDLVSQFRAVRRLHEQMRSEGESPARLDALSFAYANLGVLTERFWSPAHKVFKARALLYAQRRWSAAPDDPAALWQRAFARAAAGRHQAALEDWSAAEKRHAARVDAAKDNNSATGKRPEWADLLAAFLRGQPRLTSDEIAPPSWHPLRNLLALKTVECFTQSSLLLEAAQRVLTLTPDCPRALDVAASYRSLGTIAQGAENFTLALEPSADPSLYRRLLKIDDLPADVRRQLVAATAAGDQDPAEKRSLRAGVAGTLRDAGAADRGEPAWDVLGGLVREVEFLAAYRQLAYEQALAVPSDDTARWLAPLVADHPYALFIASHVSDRARRNAMLRTLAEQIDAADLQMTEAPMFDRLLTVDRLARARLSSAALAHNDDVFRDLVETCQRYPAEYREHFVRRLRRVAPHQAATAWLSIREDWPFAREHAEEWEEKFQSLPPILAELGRQYMTVNRLQDAERCLAAALRSQRDWPLYQSLADIYRRQGDLAKWRSTLQAFLKEPSPGLEHARARVMIAEQWMRDGKPEEALPYATDAASTGAAWAMECLAECYERLGRWEDAETLVRTKVERYPALAVDWYAWCRRTGRGDQAAAEKYAREQIASWREPSPGRLAGQIAVFHWLTGRRREALAAWEQAFAFSNNPAEGILVALVADALKETDRRDAAIKRTIEQGGQFRREGSTRGELLALAEQFRMAWSAPGEAALSRDRVDALLRDATPAEQSRLACWAARFWQLHGDAQLARAYFDRCLAEPSHAPHRVLAAVWRSEL